MATGRYTIKWIERRLVMYAESTTTQGLFFIPVFVVYPYQGTGEGEDFAKGDEDRVVDFSERMRYKPTRKQCAPEGAHCSSDDELELFHGSYCVLRF